MPIEKRFVRVKAKRQCGVSLIELVVFIIVVSIGLVTLLQVFNQSVTQSVDPAVRVIALEKAQALMEEILARKFDENTPTGGIPACDSAEGEPCAGIASDTDFDDVGDYDGYTDTSDPRFNVSVDVALAGADLGLPAAQARRVQLTVTMPGENALTLSAYKVNF